VNAQRLRLLFQEEFRTMFEKIDCLFTPTAPIPAPKIDQKTVLIDGVEEDVRLATTRFVRAINAIGLPAISLPCGSNTEGLPIGLQIVGRAFEEKLLLQIAAKVESGLRLQ
jgi:aspartyl-tRNA(Asn)/glutamyl-tRNA(Gln) amidotransferase subunit A